MEQREAWLAIWKVNRGYLVKRGCQYLVFRDTEHDQMKEAFADLLEDEDKAGQKWCGDYIAARRPVEAVPVPRQEY